MSEKIEILVWRDGEDVLVTFSQPIEGLRLNRTEAQDFSNRIGVVVADMDVPALIRARPA